MKSPQNKPLKIAILSPAHPLRGGIAASSERLAREWMARGAQVKIYSFKLQYPELLFPGKTQYTNDPPPEGLDIRPLLNSVWPPNWWKTGRLIAREKPDLLLLRYWMPFFAPALGSICRKVKKNKHTRIVCIADNIIPHEHHPGHRSLTRYFIKAVDAFVVMSRSVGKELETFDPHKPWEYVPHPVYDHYGEKVSREKALNFLFKPFDKSHLPTTSEPNEAQGKPFGKSHLPTTSEPNEAQGKPFGKSHLPTTSELNEAQDKPFGKSHLPTTSEPNEAQGKPFGKSHLPTTSELNEAQGKPFDKSHLPTTSELNEAQDKPFGKNDPSRSRYILFFGFIRKYKGLDILINSMADARLRKMNVKLLVAGEFYEDEKKYRELVQRLGLEDKVIFRNEYIPQDEVRYYFGAADIVAQPYRSATQSGISQLAYHFEKPMLVTRVGGLPEIVPHGKAGYVTDVSAPAVAEALVDFFENKRAAEMEAFAKTYKKQFSWEKLAQTIEQL